MIGRSVQTSPLLTSWCPSCEASMMGGRRQPSTPSTEGVFNLTTRRSSHLLVSLLRGQHDRRDVVEVARVRVAVVLHQQLQHTHGHTKGTDTEGVVSCIV